MKYDHTYPHSLLLLYTPQHPLSPPPTGKVQLVLLLYEQVIHWSMEILPTAKPPQKRIFPFSSSYNLSIPS